MPSKRIFQSIILQLSEASKHTIGVIDSHSVVVASSDLQQLDSTVPGIIESYDGDNDIKRIGNRVYCYIAHNKRVEYCVYVEGLEESAECTAKMVAAFLTEIKEYHDDRFDKGKFIKNLVMDNILPGDIYTRAREMNFAMEVQRAVLLIRVNAGNSISVFDIVSELFPEKQKDFVFSISETDIVVVKEIGRDIDLRDVEKLAGSIIDILDGEHYVSCVIGIGTIVNTINELATSFKEAQLALEVGKIFDNERVITTFDNLGIARLIYQLPTTLCEMYLKEVFRKGSIDSLDQETLFTIQRFFENNLNVSETSRGLFVHRNTLVYRLEKIKKITGLDLRQFDHAIVFKVALMVKKYLDSNPTKY